MKLAIVGTHQIDESEENYQRMRTIVIQNMRGDRVSEIISGGAKGIDTMAERLAKEFKVPMKIFPAQWDKYGKAAGPIRNKDIIDSCDECIAFPDQASRGTINSIKLAARQEKVRRVVFWEEIDEVIKENKFLRI